MPSTDNLKYLSDLYGVTVDYLLHDEAEKSDEPAERQESAEQPSKVPMKKHSRWIIWVMGILLAFLIGIAVGATAIPRKEKPKIRPIGELSRETNSHSDETFYFD